MKAPGLRFGLLAFTMLPLLASAAPPAQDGSCPDLVNVPPMHTPVNPEPCECVTYFLFVEVYRSSVQCQKSMNITPAHAHCEGRNEVVDCHPFGVVDVVNQEYKCECESTSSVTVEVGGILVTIGVGVAKCKEDGAPTNIGTHSTAIGLECAH